MCLYLSSLVHQSIVDTCVEAYRWYMYGSVSLVHARKRSIIGTCVDAYLWYWYMHGYHRLMWYRSTGVACRKMCMYVYVCMLLDDQHVTPKSNKRSLGENCILFISIPR